MRTVTRFEPLSVMKVAAVCYALFGFFIGAIFSVVAMVMPAIFAGGDRESLPPFFGMVFGTLAIVFFPVFYGVVGAIAAGIGAVAYNVVAKWVGGIQVEVQ